MVGQLDLPRTFVGYPSNNPYGDHGRRLVRELRAQGVNVADWQDASDPSFLWSGEGGVKAAIDGSELVLADTTSGNGNVLFELGYAIGANLHAFAMHDSTRADGMRLRVLETVRQLHYTSRGDIMKRLSAVVLGEATLLEETGVSQVNADPRRIFFLPAPNARDLSGTIDTTLRRLRVLQPARIDTDDADYNNFRALAHAISSAAMYAGVLVPDGIHDSARSNAHSMLFAGVAAGLGKQYVVLAAARREAPAGPRGQHSPLQQRDRSGRALGPVAARCRRRGSRRSPPARAPSAAPTGTDRSTGASLPRKRGCRRRLRTRGLLRQEPLSTLKPGTPRSACLSERKAPARPRTSRCSPASLETPIVCS